ncbi:Cytokinin riboside 5'-monophosphate phosphoribohydrolase [Microbacterium lemovicicum]|uniref:Cytokinin riboside 5'-monophosphate phosphoribohydrolase n=1 Tax=Microbacterium lemovicicum TaxID=1072463 RepID=A0A3Q9IXA6_9MICO|nr:TIGR00730 family Rossman fold protein [Microbacterium lemovicicum]AZS36383.1 Cytokinin riboside 5'-monophosphate phosphoribohydrolase [Microbacterium lemovicicum]
METGSTNPIPPEVTEDLRRTIETAGITESADLVARILATGIGMGLDRTDRLDLKITTAALSEMRAAFRLFAPFSDVPKVTIFGSARTRPDDAAYRQASDVAAALAGHGWMVVTGAGPGIMQAAAEGAGPDHSLGVSIRLPFEQRPNAIVEANARNVAMKYFFTRKLMLVKESSGFVCVPGGFGTLDEMFELLTLQQTGKAEPTPVVLLDEPGGTFWKGLETFVHEHLETAGVISPHDFDRVVITDSVDEATAEIMGFWRNYDSMRWVGGRLVLRLKAAPTDAEIEELNERFPTLLADGRIERTEPLRVEREDDDKIDLPRLVLRLNQWRVGELHRLIRALNDLPSAPSETAIP